MYKYHSIISNSDNDSEKEKEIFNNLLSKQVDGIIFLGGTISDEIKDLINHSSVPVVVSAQMVKMTISHLLISILLKLPRSYRTTY